jgi:enoyl-CoA hydratase
MTQHSIQLSDHDGIALVRVDHPPANALDPGLLAEALETLVQLKAQDPGAVVITGTGRFFSAGADLRVVPMLAPAEQADMARAVNELFAGWYTLPRPVVAGVNGHAVAGGLILALCGDYRVGPRSGQFGLTEVKVGIPYPSVAFAIVKNELAPGAARRLTLGAELIDSVSALNIGVFDEVVDDEQVLTRALEVARERAQLPSQAYELTKSRLRRGVVTSNDRIFGGSSEAGWATAEAPEAAARILGEHTPP